MPKAAREPVPKPPPAVPPKSTFEGVQHTFKASEAPAPDYPPDGPLGDLLAAEAVLDLLRLVHRARLAFAEALAVAVSTRAAAAVPETRRGGRPG